MAIVADILVVHAQALIEASETICELDPGMCEAAAMVYVGDIYALREPLTAVNDGWGRRHYCAASSQDPL